MVMAEVAPLPAGQHGVARQVSRLCRSLWHIMPSHEVIAGAVCDESVVVTFERWRIGKARPSVSWS